MMNASAPAATTKYRGTRRLAVLGPAWIGIRKGSATMTAQGSSTGRRRSTSAAAATATNATSAPTAATAG